MLVEPKTPGNIGAVARVMKNFGFKDLVLVNPECSHKDFDARARAKHAKDVLKKAKVKDFDFFKKYDYVIGTTARLGRDYNIPRSPITPAALAFVIKQLEKVKVALVFGREDDGLSNEEIAKCDFVVTIPTSPKYAVMNLSHSVAIVLYELNKALSIERIGETIKPIGKKEKKTLLKLINETLDKIEFQTSAKRENQKTVWKRVVGKAMLTNREAMALMGLFRKVKK